MPPLSGSRSADDIAMAADWFVSQSGKSLQVCKGAESVLRSEIELRYSFERRHSESLKVILGGDQDVR